MTPAMLPPWSTQTPSPCPLLPSPLHTPALLWYAEEKLWLCLSVHRRTVSVLDNTIDFSRRTAATPLGMLRTLPWIPGWPSVR